MCRPHLEYASLTAFEALALASLTAPRSLAISSVGPLALSGAQTFCKAPWRPPPKEVHCWRREKTEREGGIAAGAGLHDAHTW